MSDQLPSTRPQPATLLGAPPASGLAPAFRPPAAKGELGRLAGYRVLKLLGRGGMGAVYLALDESLRRNVALKVMLPAYAADPESNERFRREARAAAAVRHDNVVTVYQVGEDRGTPFIAMEFLSGYPLDQYLGRKGRLTVAQVLRVGCETADGLAAAHALGLVHRDIKSANLWLEAPQGRIKILDFGLAKPVEPSAPGGELTGTGVVMGTPAFMSPEQARGEPVDHRTDLFSLGVVLYQLTTGKRPFDRANGVASMIALATEDPVPVRELNADVPDALARVISALLEKHAGDRPKSAAAVAHMLRAVERGEAVADAGELTRAPAAAPPQVVYVPIHVTAYEPSASAFAHLTDSSASTAPDAAERTVRRPRRRARFPFGTVAGALLLAAAIIAGTVFATREPTQVVKGEADKPFEPPGKQAGAKLAPPAPKATDTPDRRLAEWLISKSGAVNIENGPQNVARAADLPAGPFRVATASMPTGKYAITDADLDRFRDTGVTEFVLGYGHAVTDVGLDKLTQFPGAERVKVFSLGSKQMTDTGCPHLARFKNLEVLTLGATEVSGAELGVCRKLPKLQTLALTWQIGVGDAAMKHLVGLKLVTLVLNETGVTDVGVKTVSSITTLEALDLYRTAVTNAGLEHVAALKNLTNLNVGGTKVTDDGLKALAALPALVHLALNATGVTDAGLEHLIAVQTLRGLNLQNTKVSTAGVKRLMLALPNCNITSNCAYDPKADPDRKLAEWVIGKGGKVRLRGGAKEYGAGADLPAGPLLVTGVHLRGGYTFKDEDVELLREAHALTDFECGLTTFSNAALERWSRSPGAPRLTRLFVCSPNVTDAGFAHLARFESLQYVALHSSRVTGPALEHLARLSKLGTLHMAGCVTFDDDLKGLANFPALTTLTIGFTDVTDVGLAHLHACKKLKQIDLTQAKNVTAEGIQALRAALPAVKVIPDPDRP